MNERTTGWLLVGVQAVLLVLLIVLPSGDDWPTPPWVDLVASVLFFGGLVLMVVAFFGLGSALTPTPVPKNDSALQTGGLYAFVRHPIYTAVLAVVAGITLRSANLVTLVVAVVTVAFFHLKARWEEERLAERFDPDYRIYAEHTPRFIPRPWQRFREGPDHQ